MAEHALQAGATITNGESAMRLTKRVETGWLGIFISLGSGQQTGTDCLLEDNKLEGWRHVPWEWTLAEDVTLEERYRWSVPGYASLVRETRPATFSVGDRVRLTEWDEGVGIVRRVGEDGGLWVETECNMWRNYPAEFFIRTAEPLSIAVTAEVAR